MKLNVRKNKNIDGIATNIHLWTSLLYWSHVNDINRHKYIVQ